MRILHLSTERTWRGGEQQIAYLIEETLNVGHEVEVMSRTGSAFSDFCQRSGVSLTECRMGGALDIRTAVRLRDLAKGVDLIHVHSGKGHDLLATAYLLGLRTPAILSRRVDFPPKHNPWSRFKYRLPIIKKCICVSDAIRTMTAHALKDVGLAVTIHSGIDRTRFGASVHAAPLHEEFGIPKDVPLIGNVSALAPHKDYFTFVDTAYRIIDQGNKAHFIIIGEGREREPIEAYIEKRGCSANITMTGFRSNIPEILCALDIFLITSRTEGLGTSVLDAMAASCPVVATAAGGIPELVTHEESGLLAQVGSSDGLAGALNRMLKEPDLRERCIRAGLEVAERHDKASTAARTIRIYEEILAQAAEG